MVFDAVLTVLCYVLYLPLWYLYECMALLSIALYNLAYALTVEAFFRDS
jgi:hypothetical protein